MSSLWSDLSSSPASEEADESEKALIMTLNKRYDIEALLELNFKLDTSFTDFFAMVKEIPKKCLCLLCYVNNTSAGDLNPKLKFIVVGNANLRSHLYQAHREILKDKDNWTANCLKIKGQFNCKRMKGPVYQRKSYVKSENESITTTSVRSKRKKAESHAKLFQLDKYNISRVKQSLWIMTSGLPSTVVENELYRSFVESLHSGFFSKSRQTEFREELLIFGQCFKLLKKRIQNAAKFFEFKPFLSVQADAWTSKGGCHVMGISCSFFCPKLKEVMSVVLKAAPIELGKTAEDLSGFILDCLKKYEIASTWVLQAIGDEEKAPQFHSAMTSSTKQ